ncbi:MAG: anthranilate phosphoribosyltransferase [Verrucomicrobiales bacterium]|nr:anthranilate phosphoribosyltransferase [Verrucomicrobiales bacterium]MDP4792370.1 anthranilate phosphoribosyltransferase [Verrucomicrobiales bacterium]MDP5005784.1 anthranilate phosphoribosyltransferase [Verrucomicrobiales bacterium]
MQDLTDHLKKGQELTADQIVRAADALLDDSLPAGEKADFLCALSDKGESPAEIAAFATAFLERAVTPTLDRERIGKPLLDVCGTGGDKLNLFNISTTSVFVLAACGVAVVKHGNRGITSKSGGADALEALGIRIDLPPEDFGRCVEEVGAGFLFAPLYHPAFKAIAPVRKQLAEAGRRSIFNLLGPLLNPAKPDYQLIGVFDPAVGSAFAEILSRLGRKVAWAVHGTTETGAGMDEISNLGPSTVWAANGPDRLKSTIEPSSLGLAPATVTDLEGGDAITNAAILTGILDGSVTGPKRDLVTLNAAGGLVITGIADDLSDGLHLANEAIASGAARAVLERWRNFV